MGRSVKPLEHSPLPLYDDGDDDYDDCGTDPNDSLMMMVVMMILNNDG